MAQPVFKIVLLVFCLILVRQGTQYSMNYIKF